MPALRHAHAPPPVDEPVQLLLPEVPAPSTARRPAPRLTGRTGPEHRLLAVDLADEPGRAFRVPPRWFPDVSVDLGITDPDFAEFADEADGPGTYRGLGDGDPDET